MDYLWNVFTVAPLLWFVFAGVRLLRGLPVLDMMNVAAWSFLFAIIIQELFWPERTVSHATSVAFLATGGLITIIALVWALFFANRRWLRWGYTEQT